MLQNKELLLKTRLDIELMRRQQLIQATLGVIEREGFQGATVERISKASGMSVGLVSHYFGGKQGLLEATMRHLLDALRKDLLQRVSRQNSSPRDRLIAIIEANFSGVQTDAGAAKTWLAFWAQAMHNPAMARLQRVNERRLYSNLMTSLAKLVPRNKADRVAQTIAALIDGFWLRAALSEGRIDSDTAVVMCVSFLDQMLEQASATTRDQTPYQASQAPVSEARQSRSR